MIRYNRLSGKWEVNYHGMFYTYRTRESAETRLALLKESIA